MCCAKPAILAKGRCWIFDITALPHTSQASESRLYDSSPCKPIHRVCRCLPAVVGRGLINPRMPSTAGAVPSAPDRAPGVFRLPITSTYCTCNIMPTRMVARGISTSRQRRLLSNGDKFCPVILSPWEAATREHELRSLPREHCCCLQAPASPGEASFWASNATVASRRARWALDGPCVLCRPTGLDARLEAL
ncbi:hypothetical protein C2E23DRAFT_233499 [Lenzites betulinus]|nr:hypothetical protein C2E23DRAFT_233499 [Lenzites betulinus]